MAVTVSAPVSALRFSRDGNVLLVGMIGGRGLAFFDMRDGTQVGADIVYDGQVQWIDVADDGRAVATGEDGRIRLYGPDHLKLKDASLPRGGHPYAAAFSPDGGTIAVGDQNSATVWLFDATTLRPIRSLTGAPGRAGGFSVVAFADGGREVVAGGTYKTPPDGRRLVRRWALDGGATEFEVGTDTITDITPLGSDLIVSDAEPILERLDHDGNLITELAANHIDFRDAGLSGFGVSFNGTAIELPLRGAAGKAFDVRLRGLVSVPPGSLIRPHASDSGLEATQWRNSTAPRLGGRPFPLERDEMSLAVAIAPGGKGAAFGTNFFVRYQRRDGIGWHVPIPSEAWTVNVSGNGERVIAGLADGSVRWYDIATGDLLLTLFVDPVDQHWVLATPQGFFDHDESAPGEPDGRSLIGYRFNDPVAEVSQFVTTGQLYPVYYRPDLVGLALSDNPAAHAAIAEAYQRRGAVQTVLMRGLPPQLEVQRICGVGEDTADATCPSDRGGDMDRPPAYPNARLATKRAALLVRYRLNNPNGQPGIAAVFRNDAHIAPRLFPVAEEAHSRTEAVLIPLGQGINTIRLLPVTGNGEIEGSEHAARAFDVVRLPDTTPEGAPIFHPRTLFLLSVGVSQYGLSSMDLPNAHNDASAIADVMKAPDPPVYERSEVTALYDGQATLSGITDAMKAIADKAQPDDLVVLFFAGHGKDVDGHYVFAPSDFGTHNPDLARMWQSGGIAADEAIDQMFRKEGFGRDRMLSLLTTIKASRVALILDTCYSAAIASQDAVIQRDMNTTMTKTLGHATGRFVLSSATEEAQDSAATTEGGAHNGRNHGLFTGYLLDVFEGRDDDKQSGQIDVVRIAKFTISMVEKATAEQQEPAFYFSGNDFFALRSGRHPQQTQVTPR